MVKDSIQIICVYKEQRKEAVKRTLDSLVNAIKIERAKSSSIGHYLISIALCGVGETITSVDWKEVEEEYAAYFELKVTTFEAHTSKARLYNEMARTSDAAYLILLHMDAVVNPLFFLYMLEPVQNKKQIGIVEAKQLPIESPKEFDRLTNETSCVLSECFLIRRCAFEACHGLDDATFSNIGWDVDFSWRVRLNGYGIYYQSLASVVISQKVFSDSNIDLEESEEYEATLATMMMAYKWSHDGLVARYVKIFEASEDVCQKKAIMTFQQMNESGSLPVQIDEDHQIARFYEGTGYTKYRYIT